MSITVTTGGPMTPGSSGPTFADLAAAIADDIDDTTQEYQEQINRAIKTAIRYCEREVYYFNETRDVTFPTVAGRQWYTSDDASEIGTLVRIEAAYCEDARGRRIELSRATPSEMEIASDSAAARGEPYAFAYFRQQVGLYPIPSSTPYTIRLQLSPYRLAWSADENDTNAWLTEAYDLLKARAKYILAKDTLKDAVLAAEALNDYNDQHGQLKAETSARNGRGFIRATCF